jgi:hypothetical protein
MAFIIADRVRDTSTTTGSGNFTVSGSAPSTYRTFSAVCTAADTFPYFIASQTLNEWEVGLATYSSANVFARTTIYSSSNAGSIVTFSTGTKDVVLSDTAEKSGVNDFTLTTLNVKGSTSGVVTVQAATAAGTYNFNLPTSAGISGQPLLSGGGSTNPMSFNALTAAVGGTGQTSYAVGDILYASGATSLAKLADVATGQVIVSGGVAAAPKYGYWPPGNVLNYITSDPSNIANAAATTTAINTAWAANPIIYIPKGRYYINGALVPYGDVHGHGIIGDGPWNGSEFFGASWSSGDGGTLIVSTATTGTVISEVAQAVNSIYQGFTLTRSSQATGGYGIDMNVGSNTNDNCTLRNLALLSHSIGLHLAVTGYSVAEWIVCANNRNSGFEICGQWQLNNLFSADNGGNGFLVDTLTAASSGQWRGLSTFNNAGYGLYVAGAVGREIEGLRISDCFFGNDGSSEVRIDSFSGVVNMFLNIYCECGGFGGGVGSNAWEFTANNYATIMTNCIGTVQTSHYGLISSAPLHQLHNCYLECVGGGGGTGIGIDLTGGASQKASIIGCTVKGFTGVGGIGISAQNMSAVSIIGSQTGTINTTGTGTVYTAGNY